MLLDRLRHRLAPGTDEPVGDVDMVGKVLRGCVLLEDGADGDVEGRILGQLLDPFLIAIDIWEGDDFVAGEDQEAVVDAGFAAGGEPDVFRHEAGTDDGGLLAFDERYRFIRMLLEQMLAEQALREIPGGGQLPGLAHQGMNPGNP